MNSQVFSRNSVLNNIPIRKLNEILADIENSSDDLSIKALKKTAITRYAESNIPIEYWFLKMEKDFTGDPRLLEKYKEYTADMKKSYVQGASICFAGAHGLGKTFCTTNILKKAAQQNFSALYTTLSDVVSTLTQAPNEDKFIAKRELLLVDFLAIDELDPRFFSNDNAADLYARTLEGIFRSRSQNKLPTIMCTNSPNVIEGFNGALKASIESLMKGYIKIFPVLGNDFRKKTT